MELPRVLPDSVEDLRRDSLRPELGDKAIVVDRALHFPWSDEEVVGHFARVFRRIHKDSRLATRLRRDGFQFSEIQYDSNRGHDDQCGVEPAAEGDARADEGEAEEAPDHEGLRVAALFQDFRAHDETSVARRTDEKGWRETVEAREASPRQDGGEDIGDPDKDQDELVNRKDVHRCEPPDANRKKREENDRYRVDLREHKQGVANVAH